MSLGNYHDQRDANKHRSSEAKLPRLYALPLPAPPLAAFDHNTALGAIVRIQ